MPVKKRLPKARQHSVTPEAASLYLRCAQLEPIYRGCARAHGQCRSPVLNRHCIECREYLDSSMELAGLLGLHPWETTPGEAKTAEPPPYWQSAEQRESWAKARSLRAALIAAARRPNRQPSTGENE